MATARAIEWDRIFVASDNVKACFGNAAFVQGCKEGRQQGFTMPYADANPRHLMHDAIEARFSLGSSACAHDPNREAYVSNRLARSPCADKFGFANLDRLVDGGSPLAAALIAR